MHTQNKHLKRNVCGSVALCIQIHETKPDLALSILQDRNSVPTKQLPPLPCFRCRILHPLDFMSVTLPTLDTTCDPTAPALCHCFNSLIPVSSRFIHMPSRSESSCIPWYGNSVLWLSIHSLTDTWILLALNYHE